MVQLARPLSVGADMPKPLRGVAFERRVFGIKPEDLEECDLPPAGTPVGNLNLDPHIAKSLFEEIRLGKN